MATSEIDVTLHKSPWWLPVGRWTKWTLTLDMGRGRKASATGRTVEAAWAGASLGAQIMFGTRVTSECPYDESGRLRDQTND